MICIAPQSPKIQRRWWHQVKTVHLTVHAIRYISTPSLIKIYHWIVGPRTPGLYLTTPLQTGCLKI